MKISYRNDIRTVFHGISPISKLLWYSFITIWLFSLRDIPNVLFMCSFIIIEAIVLAKIDLFNYLRNIVVLLALGIFLIVFQSVIQPGEGFNIYLIHFSYNGILLGAAIGLRTLGIVAAALAFSTTTKPKDLSIAFQKMGVSYRFSHLIYLSLALIPQFGMDLEDTKDALRLRGVNSHIERFIKSSVSMLAAQLRRAEAISISLETRAFGLYKTKTIMEDKSFNRSGKMLLLITSLFIVFHLFLILTHKL